MFYNIIFALAMIFPVFSCYTMDQALINPAPKPSSEKQGSETIVFPLPIPKEVDRYFVPKVEKLKIPERSRTLIVEMCNRETLSKKVDAQKKENTEIAKNNTKKSPEIFELRRQKAELEKTIAIKKIEHEKKIQELNQKKIAAEQAKTNKLVIVKQKSNSSAPLTMKDYRFALKTLMEQHRSKEPWDLFDKLINICTDINHGKLNNNMITGPYFNRKNHVLFEEITPNFRYIYYPCTRKITILRKSFNELLADINKFIDQEKICSNNCTHYKSKKPVLKRTPEPKFESISEDSQSDYSSHSSDMDTSSDHEIDLAHIR